MNYLNLIQFAIYIILGSIAGFHDFKSGKIPNKITFLVFMLGLAMNFSILNWWILFYLGLGLIVFNLKWMNAGDIKFMFVSYVYFLNFINDFTIVLWWLACAFCFLIVFHFKQIELDYQESLVKLLLFNLGAFFHTDYFLLTVLIIIAFYGFMKKVMYNFEYTIIYGILICLNIACFWIFGVYENYIWRLILILGIIIMAEIQSELKFGPFITIGSLIYVITQF